MATVPGSVMAAAVLVGLMALPAASEDLSGKESFSSSDAPEDTPVEMSTRISSDSFVRTVSTAFDEFRVNISGNSSYSVLETPDSRVETSKEPGKTERVLETDDGTLRKVESSEKTVKEVETPSGQLVEKIEDGEKVVKFDGYNRSSVEETLEGLEERLDAELGEMLDRRDEMKSESLVDIELYVQPDGSLDEGEYVAITNLESEAIDIEGYRIEDSTGKEHVFDSGEIGSGDSIRLYTDNEDAEFNIDRGSAFWAQGGDTAYLYNDEGQLVAEYSY